MRVLFICFLVALTITIYICIVLYDKKTKAEKEKILWAMWEKVKTLDSPVEVPINKIETLSACKFEREKFDALIYELKMNGIIDYDNIHMWFTVYGHQWFNFKVKEKNT